MTALHADLSEVAHLNLWLAQQNDLFVVPVYLCHGGLYPYPALPVFCPPRVARTVLRQAAAVYYVQVMVP